MAFPGPFSSFFCLSVNFTLQNQKTGIRLLAFFTLKKIISISFLFVCSHKFFKTSSILADHSLKKEGPIRKAVFLLVPGEVDSEVSRLYSKISAPEEREIPQNRPGCCK